MEEIVPPVRDLHTALLNYPQLPADYKGLELVSKWVSILGTKKAVDTLSDDEVRQLKFDLEQGFQNFNDVVLKQH